MAKYYVTISKDSSGYWQLRPPTLGSTANPLYVGDQIQWTNPTSQECWVNGFSLSNQLNQSSYNVNGNGGTATATVVQVTSLSATPETDSYQCGVTGNTATGQIIIVDSTKPPMDDRTGKHRQGNNKSNGQKELEPVGAHRS